MSEIFSRGGDSFKNLRPPKMKEDTAKIFLSLTKYSSESKKVFLNNFCPKQY